MDADTQQPRLLFTVNEAATALGIGRTMLYHLMSSGQLRPVHIGRLTRFTSDELNRFINHLQSKGPGSAEPSLSA